jgi:predicted MPP superfamily phosphohydrolase
LETSHVRQLIIGATFLVAVGSHAFVVTWLLRVFPALAKRRRLVLFKRYVAGRYEEQGTSMWVNRGFGVAGPPSRLGAPPEVTRIVLVSA